MTLETTENRIQYSTNGSTTEFSIPFKFLENSHVAAYYQNSEGLVAELTLDTHFSLSGAGAAAGGALTTLFVLATGGTLTITREVPATQGMDLVNGDSFDADVLEQAFDKLTMLAQQAEDTLSRAVVLPVTSTDETPDPEEFLDGLSYLAVLAQSSAIAATTKAGEAAASAASAAASAASISVGTAGGICGLDDDALVDAVNLPLASNAGAGIVELATAAEVLAFEDATRAITPSVLFGHGEFRLELSGSDLKLVRVGLGRGYFNGVTGVVPVAGVTLSPSGLSANTTYYIYAYLSSGTVTLEASTTAWATDATTGIPIKTGDATRVLVGMARTITGPAWADSETQRFVLSYYNRKEKVAQGALSTEVVVSSTTSVELTTNARTYFLTWGDELVTISGNAHPYNDTVGKIVSFVVGVDGATGITYGGSVMFSTNAGYRVPTNVSAKGTMLSEGLHFITPCGYVSGGSASFPAASDICTVCTAFIKG